MFLLAVLTTPLLAHHAVSVIFDTSKSVTLKGTITGVDWRNPHSSISIDVKDDRGKTVNWRVEIASIGTLTQAGLTRDMFDLSKSYSIEAFPAKDGTRQAVGKSVVFDGKTYDVSDKPPQ
jgi:hypothetical protein